ncbi:D-tyrosyl-tRNA(Tyr) deacylase [Candidatus Woesebacteria bacterium RIFCSPHIGHO2_01_FULL_44_10]|uniref:D-aminoacyl-tRNA deacylase n=1 Tax=Candidatus Woesebacteria bacterium RIFCSPLOWO2_01_FULL_44_14 TaxID=1802525 RepID=A0A1F8C3I2_9BACT|nr:MAG: D-tyrosyl-tRNA(Tyr) deacylase [Candidatus Woesebacteria bacterium RIFCSPHIGHO2_01_FULL_44_10]OGM54324.1 MAG: D-tyrosyl-tRNA(Tyr) deacylase [Candidatus Woesebacteria bacterium RIFCSPHIGHO2_12_FULL_44_11]OGM70225.1 MAG: D-tyrosyl-tRNA(Tyr) deacylase [Candidatus Woesebacteria bacterium RIFCSPLOWO2_01_FULL_44_14]
MRLVVQRVREAQVGIAGKIDSGLLVLLGVGARDTTQTVDILIKKLANLRVMADKEGKMNLSVRDTKASVLVVSQFTLYADTSKGNRPSFIKAATPDKARELYDYFVARLQDQDIKVETGSFGEYMKINALLDGPVTILFEE